MPQHGVVIARHFFAQAALIRADQGVVVLIARGHHEMVAPKMPEPFKDRCFAIQRRGGPGPAGVLPGGGAVLASFAAYPIEKKIKLKAGEVPLGQGNIRGVAGPESANNAAVPGAYIPMMTLGIPGDAVMAIMLGALIIHGIQPGPMLINEQPEMFWGLVVSFAIGNINGRQKF